uniref:Uncharacterized protein LOC100178609 n=1 Tax=Phallusia mammillata TaxID=59560 RepID=A0A6F9DG55_9ASCI|nr:uncharacterized protein LOC100178609 [Phallusia mammillata]
MGTKQSKEISSSSERQEQVGDPDKETVMEEQNTTEKQVSCVVVGAGQRGSGYATYAKSFPDLLKIVAVADPSESNSSRFKKTHNIDDSMVFSGWKELATMDKMADFACICTPDRVHKDAAMAFIKKGYHILLEKPMATSEEDCTEICEACKEHNVMLCVCHVLRYYPPNLKIKELIESGIIGDVVTIQHLEPVGFFHFAHSYVRGNWRNTEQSSFSLLAKSCHDIDLICSWMPTQCKRVSSFGSLNHFKPENKPKDAGNRCTDCSVESTCPYSAVKIYLDRAKRGNFRWPVSIVTDVEDLEVLKEKLQTGPYGRCVYECDNDVCDNQVVNMEFEGGKTASFTMIAFTESVCARQTKVFGTLGELTYNGDIEVDHFDFLSKQRKTYYCTSNATAGLGGHGGADFHLVQNFIKAVAENDPSYIKSGIDETLESHRIVFAAEQSRLSGKTYQRTDDGKWVVS